MANTDVLIPASALPDLITAKDNAQAAAANANSGAVLAAGQQRANNAQQARNNAQQVLTDRAAPTLLRETPDAGVGWNDATLTLSGRGWYVAPLGQPLSRLTVYGRLYRSPNAAAVRALNWEVRAATSAGALLASGQLYPTLGADWVPLVLDLPTDIATQELYVRVWTEDPALYLELRNSEGSPADKPESEVQVRTSTDPTHWAVTGRAGVYARYEYRAPLAAPVLTPAGDSAVGLRAQQAVPLGLSADQTPTRLLGAVVNSQAAFPYEVTASYNDIPITSWAWDAGALPDQTRYVEVAARTVAGSRPTTATLTVYDTGLTGAVLATVTVPVLLPDNGDWERVRFDLGVALAGRAKIWLDVAFNGRIQLQQCKAVIPDRVSANAQVRTTDNATRRDVGTKEFVQNARFYSAAGAAARRPIPNLAPTVQAARIGVPEFVTPPKLFAVVGQELSLYPRQMALMTTDGYRDCVILAYGEGTAGSVFRGDRWAWTPGAGDVGQARSMVIQIHDPEGVFITAQRYTITVSAANAGGGVTRRVIMLTDSHGRRGYWPQELQNLMDAAGGMNFVQVGTKGQENGGQVGENYPGWSVQDAITYPGPYNNEYNAFMVTGVFSVPDYMQRFNKELGDNDWFVVAHGTNSNDRPTPGNMDMALYESYLLKDAAAYEQIIASVKAYNSKIRIAIATCIPNAWCPGEEQFRLAHRHARYNRMLLRFFGGREAEGIYLLPHGHALDREQGYPRVLVNRSARITDAQISTFVDTVHPREVGYKQMADSDLAFFKAMG